jgi:hypothetical protein
VSDYYDYIDQEAALAEAYFYEQHLQQQYEEEEIEDINANFNTYKY